MKKGIKIKITYGPNYRVGPDRNLPQPSYTGPSKRTLHKREAKRRRRAKR